MSKSKHTPGPWKRYKRRLRPNIGPVIREVQTRDGKAVVHWGGFDGVNMPKAEIDANVRLMAAAPELLVAAKLALEYFDRCVMSCDPDEEEVEEAAALRAAIAKAEGRQEASK
jgi:hypothetical protein